MRIIHCGDLHLDADLRSRFDAASAAERRAELLDTFRRLCHCAKEENVSAVLLCGDLFDTQAPSLSAVRTVEDLILGYSDILFFYLRGNHDSRSLLFETREKPENFFMFGEDWTSWELSEDAAQSRRVCITGRETGGAAFSSPSLDPSCLNIVMLHGQIREGYTASDPESLPLGALRGCGIDYLALGHLHRYRSFKLDGRGTAAYCGCLEGRGFDECGRCGFVMIDTDAPGLSLKTSFVPFSSRCLYSVDCDITGCCSDTEVYERIRRSLGDSPATERDLVRLTLTGELEYMCSPDPAFLKREWEGRYHYFAFRDASEPVIHSEDFLCDASLKGEFVRVVSAAGELGDEECRRILRCGLRALSGSSLF